MEQILCPWEPAKFLIYSSNIPTLFFYSHIPAIIVALLMGFIVFFRTNKSRIGIVLLNISILFSIWSIFDLILWATNRPDTVMFFWSLQILIEPLVYLLCFYLLFLFAKDRDLSFKWKSLGILLYLPIIVFLPSSYNLIGVETTYCTAVEGFLAQYFTYVIEISIIILTILFTIIVSKRAENLDQKKEVRLFGLGVILFLFAFSSGNIIGSFTENWNLAQAGLIGMPIFVGFLAYLIVRFKIFNMKILGAQALVLGLTFLVLSILFIRNISNVRLVTAATLVLVSVAGHLLIKSVRREVKQREELQRVSEELFEANDKLKGLDKLKTEFLSLASHQLRSPLTAINGYTSMLLEGDFGQVNDKQKETISRVYESSKHLTKVVNDLLNVSKIEQGGMQYTMAPFDLEKAAKDLVTDLSITAENKGLKLDFETDNKSPYTVNGDMEKIRQVILNLVDNSIKYTKTGGIKVKLIKDESKKKVRLAISDTGMGIPSEVVGTLFQKFSRGEGEKMNTSGSGLGLYLAKTIVGAHKGKIWAESSGRDQGSTFFIELNIA